MPSSMSLTAGRRGSAGTKLAETVAGHPLVVGGAARRPRFPIPLSGRACGFPVYGSPMVGRWSVPETLQSGCHPNDIGLWLMETPQRPGLPWRRLIRQERRHDN